jgi:hypothetical protein
MRHEWNGFGKEPDGHQSRHSVDEKQRNPQGRESPRRRNEIDGLQLLEGKARGTCGA